MPSPSHDLPERQPLKPALAWLKRAVGLAADSGERRRQQRREVVGDISITIPGGDTSPAFVRNVTRGGIGIWSRVRYDVGQAVIAEVREPACEGQSHCSIAHLMARVKHCRGNENSGFAIGLVIEREATELPIPRQPVRKAG